MMERKEKLIRVLQILETSDENMPLNASQIAERLERDYKIGRVDRRSIYRDIATLTTCGYNIKQANEKRNGWYMAEHLFEDWELKIMLDAIMQSKCVTIKEAGSIRERILSLTSLGGRSRLTHLMEPLSQNIDAENPRGKFIGQMIKAMTLKRKILFQYTEIDMEMHRVLRKDGREYLLNLYAIYWANNTYYMIGAHDDHEGLTSYRLDRVESMKISDETMIDPREKIGQNPEQYIQDYIVHAVNHYSGDLVRVEIDYTANQKNNAILYDFAAGDISVQKLEGEKYRATFSKLDGETLTTWCMQYADQFHIVAPVSLRIRVKARLADALKEYENH